MKSARLSEASRCTRCLVRWKQSKLGLCRSCEHELGIEAEGTLEREAERLTRRQVKDAEAAARYHLDPVPGGRQPYTLERTPTGGRVFLDYVVVWHGGMDGAAAMGRPMASEKASPWTGITRDRGERKGSGLRHPGAFERD